MKDIVRLNIGCGEYKHAGWFNIDTYPICKPDILANADNLPFEDETVDRIYFGHVLEHMTYEDEAPAALREAYRVLKPGGEVCVVGPDYDAAVRLGFGQDTLDDIIGGIIVDPELSHQGLEHQWLASETNTVALVASVFPNVQVSILSDLAAANWPLTSLISWQMGCKASKPYG